jgi:cobalt/nickel transport system ATP-binding protein
VTVCNVDVTTEGEVSAWIAAHRGTVVGAMGTRAKERASREKIPLDLTYGVIDKCILKALAGEDSLILTSEGMFQRVFDRIRSYSAESGFHIPVHTTHE